jgi:kynurenine formamidase
MSDTHQFGGLGKMGANLSLQALGKGRRVVGNDLHGPPTGSSKRVSLRDLSVARNNEVGVHRALLETGAWILEGLDLSRVEPGDVELLCLRLKVEGAEGASARALLRARR